MHCAHFSARRNSQSTEVVWPIQTAASLPGEWVPRLGVLKGTQPGYPPGSPGGIALSPNRLRYIEPGRAGGAGSSSCSVATPGAAPPTPPHYVYTCLRLSGVCPSPWGPRVPGVPRARYGEPCDHANSSTSYFDLRPLPGKRIQKPLTYVLQAGGSKQGMGGRENKHRRLIPQNTREILEPKLATTSKITCAAMGR